MSDKLAPNERKMTNIFERYLTIWVPLAALLIGLSMGRSAVKARTAASAMRIISGVLLIGVGLYFLIAI